MAHRILPASRLPILAGLAIAICLVAAFSAQSAAAHTRQLPFASDFFVTVEEDEAIEVSEEEVEEEWEAEIEEEEDEGEDPLVLPSECVLYTATARVTASASHNTVRLAVHYASYEPAKTIVDYWLKGGKGSLKLRTSQRHTSRQGNLHIFEHLSNREMEKVQAAKVFIVHIDPASTPSYCDSYSTLHLSIKRPADGQTTWSEPRTGTQPLRR